jgi:hypothetical protein
MLPVVLLRPLSLYLSILLLSWCVGLVALLDFLALVCELEKNTNVPPIGLALCAVLFILLDEF